ncbi:MAG: extensin family protein [Pseudomonadota bacterium]
MAKRPPQTKPSPPREGPKPDFTGLKALLVALLVAGAFGLGFWALEAFRAPFDPLATPDVTTPWKLSRTAEDPALCQAALSAVAQFTPTQDREDSHVCHIRGQVVLTHTAGVGLRPMPTRCASALRLALWVEHNLKPLAQTHLGADITQIHHFGSFSCRRIRTSAGEGRAMSAHATANAIDISGLSLSDGRRLSLKDSWSSPESAAFWQAARKGACTWFPTVLSPDYNSLHADHFHLAKGRWSACR